MKLTPLTLACRKLNDHIYKKNGIKSVCVSTALCFFGVEPDEYSLTSSHKNPSLFLNILRRKGYSVRSRKSKLKLTTENTTTEVRRALKKSEYSKNDYFIFWGYQRKSTHVIVLNGDGETIIDTAPGKRWKFYKIYHVFDE